MISQQLKKLSCGREYAAAFKMPDADLSQLAASSVIRSGVKAAEYKSGKALEDSG